MTTEVKANLFNHARNHVREMSDVIMKCSGIMKQRIVLILATLLFGSIYAQDGVRPVYYDYNYIELCLSFKDSEGSPIRFYHSNPYDYTEHNYRLNKKFRFMSFYNQFRIGSQGPKDLPEMEAFYRKVYEDLSKPDNPDRKTSFTDALTTKACIYHNYNILSINKTFITPNENYYVYSADNYSIEKSTKTLIPQFKTDSNIYFRYAASDNVVYDPTDLLGERLVETPYFVPIGYLEVFFVEDNKLMHIDFEMYDYNKLGISRQSYELDSTKLNIIDLSIEIQFQEGEFVITDESYPNLIPKREK